MRDIIFRGKCLFSGEWVFGNLELFSDVNGEKYARIKYDSPFTDDELGVSLMMSNDILVDPTTVGQYTGLHDKNGNMIFEGDLLSVPSLAIDGEETPVLEIIYRGSEFVVTDRVVGNFVYNLEIACTEDKGVEVVGNVHDYRLEELQ